MYHAWILYGIYSVTQLWLMSPQTTGRCLFSQMLPKKHQAFEMGSLQNVTPDVNNLPEGNV